MQLKSYTFYLPLKMDPAISQYLSVFCGTVLFIIVSWTIVYCLCCRVTYVHSRRYLSTIDEERPSIVMKELAETRTMEDHETNHNSNLNIHQGPVQENG